MFTKTPLPLLLLAMVIAGGCQSSLHAGRKAPGVHDDIRGENVEVKLITYDDWETDAYRDLEITLPERPGAMADRADADAFRFYQAAAGAVIGAAIDFIQAEIRKEAAKHERQFRGGTYADDFWSVRGQPTYAGFEVIRTTDAHGACDPAYRLICAFEYSEHDPRLCLIKPVYLKITAAKAKVSLQGGKRRIASKANIFITGAWIGDKDAFVQQDLANATFTQSSYDLATASAFTASYDRDEKAWTGKLKDQVYGYFRGPPPSSDRVKNARTAQAKVEHAEGGTTSAADRTAAKALSDQALAGGAFQLSILVTETDKSMAKDMLIKFADYVGSQKQAIIEAVVE